MTAPSWPARRAEFERVKPKLLDGNVSADELEACAAKLMQRARDIRHTESLVARIHGPKLPRCIECDAEQGTWHFGSCSYFGDGAGVRVE